MSFMCVSSIGCMSVPNSCRTDNGARSCHRRYDNSTWESKADVPFDGRTFQGHRATEHRGGSSGRTSAGVRSLGALPKLQPSLLRCAYHGGAHHVLSRRVAPLFAGFLQGGGNELYGLAEGNVVRDALRSHGGLNLRPRRRTVRSRASLRLIRLGRRHLAELAALWGYWGRRGCDLLGRSRLFRRGGQPEIEMGDGPFF